MNRLPKADYGTKTKQQENINVLLVRSPTRSSVQRATREIASYISSHFGSGGTITYARSLVADAWSQRNKKKRQEEKKNHNNPIDSHFHLSSSILSLLLLLLFFPNRKKKFRRVWKERERGSIRPSVFLSFFFFVFSFLYLFALHLGVVRRREVWVAHQRPSL